ncbi:MAG TPA: PAS domain S-box protein [Verrucomicrobiae bacterium]|jgi:PAS domain S-box-containing protein|nr:PAS domain S-box protein [Verrucomicrobiae bacterium]
MASTPVKSSPPSSWNILAAIVDSSDDAIISKNLNGIITSWNTSAERLFGYRADEIIGQSIMLLIPPELQHDEVQILRKIKAGERIEHFQTVRMKKSGERMEVSLTISPVKDERGVIVGAAKILRDITKQKKLEAIVHTSERLASVGRLAATVAHEINNPLEAVTNYVYLAKQQPDLPPKIKQYLDSADAALARVAHIAQQTLGFYRENFQPTTLVISKIIDDVLAIYERRFKYKRLGVDRRIDSGLTVSGFEGEMKQMLSNLITNALDACRDDGRIIIAGRSTRRFPSGQPGICITIADDGVGISDQDKLNLFTPFFTTKKSLGTGLGLWITKELLENRGGRVRFRSRTASPSGTVMRLYIPQEPQGNVGTIE